MSNPVNEPGLFKLPTNGYNSLCILRQEKYGLT